MNLLTAGINAFIPRDSNNHRAHILQTPVLAVLLFLFLVTQQRLYTVDKSVLGYASQISTSEVIRITNAKRADIGLPPVTENSTLSKAAKAKGEHMLAKGYWAHVAPDGTQPWDFFKSVGYKYRYAGENLARDFMNASSAVDAWMASPSHKENMLSNKYKEIGVAVVEGNLNGKDATIIVQLFGTTMSGIPQVPVVSASEKNTALASTDIAPEVESNAPPVEHTIAADPVVSINSSYPRIFSLAVVGFIFSAVVVDMIILWLKGKQHKSGKPLAQLAFLGMIIALIVVARAGQIL